MSTTKTAPGKLDKLQNRNASELTEIADVAKPGEPTSAPGTESAEQRFAVLNLRAEILQAIVDAGYDAPTPIQLQTIPHVLAGRDLLGQAETGSGKTAAFACPLLSMVDIAVKQPQVLILAPTRELAIQVTAAIEAYAKHLRGFRALTIYGGQSYDIQLNQLKRGVHIVVGTPGRVMDHMRRQTLNLQALKCLVLDEADEMLRMGFVDDVEWILTKTPQQRQILLFSATLPEPIRRIAQQHLKDPQQITVKGRTMTADAIRQRYVETAAREKIETLSRILASENTDGVIVFVRTRSATIEVAEKLTDAGYSAAPLNGDMPQSLRERTVDNFRRERLAVLVATDVAARGLDVDRVSHVINFDFPNDSEVYVHRIGRTGRAGRSGEAILFVGHREKGQLRRLEGATRQRIERMNQPSIESINEKRLENFKQQILDAASDKNLASFAELVDDVAKDNALDMRHIAAALAKLLHGDNPLLISATSRVEQREQYETSARDKLRALQSAPKESAMRSDKGRPVTRRDGKGEGKDKGDFKKRARTDTPNTSMRTYRIEVGRAHDVEVGNIVGAIANESGISSAKIGRIDLHDMHSTVDLPDGLDENFFRSLDGVRIAGQHLRIAPVEPGRSKPTKPGKAKVDKGKRVDIGKTDGTRKPKLKTKSKRVDKDKGKRRKPTSDARAKPATKSPTNTN